MAMSMPNTGALNSPVQKVVGAIALFMRIRYCGSGMPSRYLHSSAPPVRPTASAITVSSGSAMTRPRTRGRTSASKGFTPIACSASTSAFRCIEPSSAAKALPERPATMIAVSSTPSSRSTPIVTRSTTNSSAPKRASCCALM